MDAIMTMLSFDRETLGHKVVEVKLGKTRSAFDQRNLWSDSHVLVNIAAELDKPWFVNQDRKY
jgi:hypothetical protein